MIKYRLLNKNQAGDYINKKHPYFQSLTPFFIKEVMKKEASIDDFIVNFQNNCFDFSDFAYSEIKVFEHKINTSLQRLNLNIDEEIYLIRTNGKESINLPYTIGEAVITPSFHRFHQDDLLPLSVLIHETFHILSRLHPALRESCYESLGWINGHKNLIPDDMKSEIFINPDALTYQHVYPINNEFVMPITYQKIGNDLLLHFDQDLVLQKTDKMYKNKVYKDCFKNTNYINHPEEICAEHFRILLSDVNHKITDWEILESFRKALENFFG